MVRQPESVFFSLTQYFGNKTPIFWHQKWKLLFATFEKWLQTENFRDIVNKHSKSDVLSGFKRKVEKKLTRFHHTEQIRRAVFFTHKQEKFMRLLICDHCKLRPKLAFAYFPGEKRKSRCHENPSNGKFPQNDQCKLHSIIYSQTRSTINTQSNVRLHLGRKWFSSLFYYRKNFLLFKATNYSQDAKPMTGHFS